MRKGRPYSPIGKKDVLGKDRFEIRRWKFFANQKAHHFPMKTTTATPKIGPSMYRRRCLGAQLKLQGHMNVESGEKSFKMSLQSFAFAIVVDAFVFILLLRRLSRIEKGMQCCHASPTCRRGRMQFKIGTRKLAASQTPGNIFDA